MEPLPEFWNIDKNSSALLQALIYTLQPSNILEVGTSNGYSAIVMGHIAKKYGGRITTIEFFKERVGLARENIQNNELSEIIEVLQGDAVEILSRLPLRTFDFIFLDANKEEYAQYFQHAMQLVNPSGIIVADNTSSHANKLSAFFQAVEQEPRAHALQLEIGTGLMVITVNPRSGRG